MRRTGEKEKKKKKSKKKKIVGVPIGSSPNTVVTRSIVQINYSMKKQGKTQKGGGKLDRKGPGKNLTKKTERPTLELREDDRPKTHEKGRHQRGER